MEGLKQEHSTFTLKLVFNQQMILEVDSSVLLAGLRLTSGLLHWIKSKHVVSLPHKGRPTQDDQAFGIPREPLIPTLKLAIIFIDVKAAYYSVVKELYTALPSSNSVDFLVYLPAICLIFRV